MNQTNQGSQKSSDKQQVICQMNAVTEFIDSEGTQTNPGDIKLNNSNLEFVHVACGSEHSFALTTTGELYSWGLGFKGQLGHGDFENRPRPCLVKNVSPSFLESGQLDDALNAA